jgi:hypothetical protein
VEESIPIEQALHDPNWRGAIAAELQGLKDMGTYEEVSINDLPPGQKLVGTSLKLKKKLKSDGTVDRYKARLVCQGFKQPHGSYGETYAPTVKASTVRLLFALLSLFQLLVTQVDVKQAFLEAILKEEVYLMPCLAMGLPAGVILRLRKSLYGLKQASKNWHDLLHSVLISVGLVQSVFDQCLYMLFDGVHVLFLGVHVDDLFICFDDVSMRDRVLEALAARFTIVTNHAPELFLGYCIRNTSSGVHCSAPHYINLLLSQFHMSNCKSAPTPSTLQRLVPRRDDEAQADISLFQSIVGALLYLACSVRPDIAYSVGQLCRYSSNPSANHLIAAKRVCRYLSGTKSFGIFSPRSALPVLDCFSDSDHAGHDDRRSISGCLVRFGTFPLFWMSKSQHCVAASSTEAEYIACSLASREVMYFRNLLAELKMPQSDATVIYEDNQSTIASVNNPASQGRLKHLDVSLHVIKDYVAKSAIKLEYVSSSNNVSDLLTKPLALDLFVRLRDLIPMRP